MAKEGKYVYDWPRPMVTVDAAVFTFSGDAAKVLLINRGNEPFKGMWALPGGFVGMDEELEDLRAQGLVGWVSKPPSLEQLAHMVARAIEER